MELPSDSLPLSRGWRFHLQHMSPGWSTLLKCFCAWSWQKFALNRSLSDKLTLLPTVKARTVPRGCYQKGTSVIAPSSWAAPKPTEILYNIERTLLHMTHTWRLSPIHPRMHNCEDTLSAMNARNFSVFTQVVLRKGEQNLWFLLPQVLQSGIAGDQRVNPITKWKIFVQPAPLRGAVSSTQKL